MKLFHDRLLVLTIVSTGLLFGSAKITFAQPDSKVVASPSLQTPFEKSEGRESPEYAVGIDFYRALVRKHEEVRIRPFGPTDSGQPLHAVLISQDSDFDVESNRKKGRSVLLINNAIHPGETDGVDASMLFARDLLALSRAKRKAYEKVLIVIIPYYNIGGALNRNRFSRANQNGPLEYGFRGNARNYDLNRDFIKCDTRNAKSFAEIFHAFDPDLFIDTHVSNGADYQHVMTTTHSQKDKLGGKLGQYLDKTFEPELFALMKKDGYHTIPYVNAFRSTPDKGWSQFLETPRYSTGYTALFHCMGFMTETHMLKPYQQRVDATRLFLKNSLDMLSRNGEVLRRIRQEDRDNYVKQKKVPVTWKVDRSRFSKLEFKGYESSLVESKVTVGKRLFYDRDRPFTKNVNYFNHYVPDIEVNLPAGYIIPQGQVKVLELMRLNKIQMWRAKSNLDVDAEVYFVEKVSHGSSPYEGHYFHSSVELKTTPQKVRVRNGDFIVPIQQKNARYIVETLEPEAADSLFRWNFFDTILERKEHYSSYIFEESAKELLAKDQTLRASFEKRKLEDKKFAADRRQQLDFLYQRSPHAEAAYRRYPIYRLPKLPSK